MPTPSMRQIRLPGLLILAFVLLALAGCSDATPQPAAAAAVTATDVGSVKFQDAAGGVDAAPAGTDAKVETGGGADGDTPADTASPDSDSPDADAPDAAELDIAELDAASPDTAEPDVASPDTAGPDAADAAGDGVQVAAGSCAGHCGAYDASLSCQCDDYCSSSGDCCADFAALCAETGCTKDAECDDFDPCTADTCSTGTCKHAGTGACCKTDADCGDSNACTADACTSAGCQHTAKSCNDGLTCTLDSCDAKTGACTAAPQASTCAIDGVCRAAGETAENPCLACDPGKAQGAWTPKTGAGCDDGSACTSQDACDANGQCVGVAKSGCCKADSDCASDNPCSVGTCDGATGACSFAAKASCCSAGTCCDVAKQVVKAAGQACGTTAIQVDYACSGNLAQKRDGFAGCDGATASGCSTAAASLSWSAWKTVATCAANQKCVQQAGAAPICQTVSAGACTKAAECDDKNPCTDDACTASACTNLPKKCPAGTGCQVGSCNPSTGACGLQVQDNSCFIGGQCLASGTKSATDGCLTCQPAKSQSEWSLTTACSCTSGVCCDVKAGKIQAFGVACGTETKATEYACNATGTKVQLRTAVLGCTGKSNTCSVSASNYAWSAWSDVKTCAAGTTCEVTDPAVAGTCKAGADPLCGQADKYETGTTVKTAWNLGAFSDTAASVILSPKLLLGATDDVDVLRWTVTDAANTKSPAVNVSWSGGGTVKVCAWYACTAGAGGKSCKAVTCPAGTVKDSNPDVSTVTGNGCCLSGQTGSMNWTPAASSGTDGSGTAWLSVTNTAGKCQQVDVTLGFGATSASACTANTTCCTASGNFAADATPCGTATVAAEYKCESTAKGGKILQRKAVNGCLGTSTTCSTAAAHYAWSAWAAIQTCAANQVCDVAALDKPGTCKTVSVCVPGTACCGADGAWAAKGTACGTSAAKIEYQCASTAPGAAVQVRKGYGGCTGTGATCSVATASLTWSPWYSFQTCATSAVCVPGATAATPPACQTPAVNLCGASDPNYGATTLEAPKDLGEHADADKALWLAPKVALSSDADKDFFKYMLFDDINLTDPLITVSWSAAKPVTVCAYYQCLLGPSGKNCDPVKCPAGSTAYLNSVVSSVDPNGCCMDGASGTLTFSPNAPGTLDETGWVHFNIKNKAGSGCQQVAVKLAFGDDTTTVCDPALACCGDAGTWDAKGTPCGAVVKSEYQCSKATAGGVMQKRDATGTCGGTASTCSVSTTAWGPWTTALACIEAEVCSVPVATSAGTCKPSGGGSCGGACGGQAKDGACYCDSLCVANGDCCADFAPKCGGSCAASCGGKSADGVCWCDGLCSKNGDCCLDKAAKCGG